MYKMLMQVQVAMQMFIPKSCQPWRDAVNAKGARTFPGLGDTASECETVCCDRFAEGQNCSHVDLRLHSGSNVVVEILRCNCSPSSFLACLVH